jgi:hypothetical protein
MSLIAVLDDVMGFIRPSPDRALTCTRYPAPDPESGVMGTGLRAYNGVNCDQNLNGFTTCTLPKPLLKAAPVWLLRYMPAPGSCKSDNKWPPPG